MFRTMVAAETGRRPCKIRYMPSLTQFHSEEMREPWRRIGHQQQAEPGSASEHVQAEKQGLWRRVFLIDQLTRMLIDASRRRPARVVSFLELWETLAGASLEVSGPRAWMQASTDMRITPKSNLPRRGWATHPRSAARKLGRMTTVRIDTDGSGSVTRTRSQHGAADE